MAAGSDMHDASWRPPFLGVIWLTDLSYGTAWTVIAATGEDA